jgi:hypothetical protein
MTGSVSSEVTTYNSNMTGSISSEVTTYNSNMYGSVSSELTRYNNNITGSVCSEVTTMPTIPKHLSPHPDFNGIRVVRSLVFCLVFC